MSMPRRSAVTLCAVAGLLVLSSAPADAGTYHHSRAHHVHGTHTAAHRSSHGHKTHAQYKHGAKGKKATANKHNNVWEAQSHLSHLGYYNGSVDGKYGAKTKAAVKAFQLHNGLKVDGKVGSLTLAALRRLDLAATSNFAPPPVATAAPLFGEVAQHYADVGSTTPIVPSRFAQVQVNERDDAVAGKVYDVTVNDQPLITAEEQPAIIGVSRTFSLDNEDVVIFTAYRPNDTICSYKHFLLSLTADGTHLHEIMNCTRGYQASAAHGSVFVTFPEEDDARVVGATWRYDNGSLQKL